MTYPKFAASRRGFTLIELLIVIVVIAILALVVIPKVMGAGRKAKEATLKANLHQLRNALEQFQADTGLYPINTTDLVALRSNPPPQGVTEGGVTQDIPAGTYQGPYLSPQGGINNSGLPVNPFIDPQDPTYADPTSHWNYAGGIVHPAAPTGTTLDGVAYDQL